MYCIKKMTLSPLHVVFLKALNATCPLAPLYLSQLIRLTFDWVFNLVKNSKNLYTEILSRLVFQKAGHSKILTLDQSACEDLSFHKMKLH